MKTTKQYRLTTDETLKRCKGGKHLPKGQGKRPKEQQRLKNNLRKGVWE